MVIIENNLPASWLKKIPAFDILVLAHQVGFMLCRCVSSTAAEQSVGELVAVVC